jgi:hypothetical protein
MGALGWIALLGGAGAVAWIVMTPSGFFAISPSGAYEYFGSGESAYEWAKGKKGTRVYQLKKGHSEFDGSYRSPDPSARLLMSINGRRRPAKKKRVKR